MQSWSIRREKSTYELRADVLVMDLALRTKEVNNNLSPQPDYVIPTQMPVMVYQCVQLCRCHAQYALQRA